MVSLPGSNQARPGQLRPEVRFAAPPIPDLDALKACKASSSSEKHLMECMVEKAMPPAYRLTRQCLEENPDDPGAALLCSSGNKNLQDSYRRVREVQTCAEDASDKTDLLMCLGRQTLGPAELYYANCLANNRDSWSAAAVCALARDLTPEQQIALNCAMQTGGQPQAFAACTGGKLLKRELTKCWENGIATENGCFGPNNEIIKFWRGVDGTLRNALGESNDMYKAFVFVKNNALAPGPNHELVKAANTALGDIRRGGLGPNNDLVKAGNALSNGLQSVGSAVGNALGIKF